MASSHLQKSHTNQSPTRSKPWLGMSGGVSISAVNCRCQDTAGEPLQTGVRGREASGRMRRDLSTSEVSLSEEKNDVSQNARNGSYS
jgi:hypothetical protein